MNSRVAAILSRVNSQVSGLGGYGPTPVPSDAVFPYVTAGEQFDSELESMTGKSGKVFTIVQVSAWSKSYEEAFQVREAVKTSLLGFTGTVVGQVISSVNHKGGGELYDGPRELHQLIARFKVWWDSNA